MVDDNDDSHLTGQVDKRMDGWMQIDEEAEKKYEENVLVTSLGKFMVLKWLPSLASAAYHLKHSSISLFMMIKTRLRGRQDGSADSNTYYELHSAGV